MELTESYILSQLKVKRERLKSDLAKVEIAIEAYESAEEDAEGMSEAESQDLAITKLMYNARMTREQKVIYVLGKIGEGDINDIANYLMEIDSTVHPSQRAKIYERLTWVASRMYKAGKIDAYKIKNKNVYRLLG
ncbi:hypothetical protein BDD43_3686 [Mucilaginibacter gracilis]|uniref:Uncharacterized protein n=1 Tax=Mucilaginibacter gracilis TaxID=423350 RepID=A0A495J3F8_9SPHI|nr:hypothetical protein [Mucilaginibacter gracilis]RKR83477.1 hypothetical protein BDD43_3686 [Mucilaginibacter gracilis]